jgi:hypothetical protein
MQKAPFIGFDVFIAAILFSISALAQPPQTNLVARWSFDEGMGTNVTDVSGNRFNGVLEGMPLPGKGSTLDN